MNLGNIMLSERSHTLKDPHCVIPLTEGIVKFIETESRTVAARFGAESVGNYYLTGIEFLHGMVKKF